MIATTTKITEAAVDDFPDVTVSTEAAPFLTAAWARVEAYTVFRTTERDVEFIVESEGHSTWSAPLRPVEITTVERWTGSAWEAVTLSPSPTGGYVLNHGIYRFQGSAGDDAADPPPLIAEAVRRLGEYMAAKPGKPGASSESVTAGSVTVSTTRSPSWMAKAIDNSGAGDLLRSFRR